MTLSSKKKDLPALGGFFARALPFWAELPVSWREDLLTASDLLQLHPGEELEPAAGLLLVWSGCLRGFISSEGGRETTLFRIQAGGSCFAPQGHTPPHGLQASEDTLAVRLAGPIWNQLMDSHPAVCRFALDTLAGQMDAAVAALSSQLYIPVEERVAAFLAARMAESGPSLALTHSEIALHLGTTREVVTRALTALRRQGVLRTGRGTIRILRPEALPPAGKFE